MTTDAIIRELEEQRNFLAARAAKFAGQMDDMRVSHAREIAMIRDEHRSAIEAEADRRHQLADRVEALEARLASLAPPADQAAGPVPQG